MRILAVSDIHLQKQNIALLKERLGAMPFAAVLVLGDITNHGSEFAAEEILKELRRFGKVFAIPGNMDTKEVLALLENKGQSIHNQLLAFGEYSLCGFGGGLKGGAGHINFTEKDIEKKLGTLLPADCSKTILVSHLPPFGTSLDLTKEGKHIGSRAIKKILETKQPLLHLCGHVHDAAGEELFGRTTSCNIGALKDGKAAVIDLNGKIKIEKIESV